jgi:hypothetical protein
LRVTSRAIIVLANIQGERREAAAAGVRFVSELDGCLPFAPPCGFADPNVFVLTFFLPNLATNAARVCSNARITGFGVLAKNPTSPKETSIPAFVLLTRIGTWLSI